MPVARRAHPVPGGPDLADRTVRWVLMVGRLDGRARGWVAWHLVAPARFNALVGTCPDPTELPRSARVVGFDRGLGLRTVPPLTWASGAQWRR